MGYDIIHFVRLQVEQNAGVSELADEADSKSVVGNNVRVQVPLPAVLKIAETPVKSRGSAFFLLKLF